MQKKFLIITLAPLVFLIAIGTLFYFLRYKTKNEIINPISPPLMCLNENQQADFKIERLGKYPSVEYNKGFAEIIVKNKITNSEIRRFKIDDIIDPSHSHPIELHQCGVYIIKEFNFDRSSYKALPGFRVEIWRYDYTGNGRVLVVLAEENETGIPDSAGVPGKHYVFYYSYDFRIDPNEKYIVLERGYLGKDDYALVIKDLSTKQDIFMLPIKSIAEQYPDRVGNFGMLEWSQDGRYFWGRIFDGAYSLAYFRVEASSWKADIFEAADGSLGGMPLNVNTGYLPIQPGLVWTGDVELTQELKEKDRREGKKSSLSIYNLFTKEKILIATTDEPQFFFKPKWLSDTELEYTLPSGEKRIYTIK